MGKFSNAARRSIGLEVFSEPAPEPDPVPSVALPPSRATTDRNPLGMPAFFRGVTEIVNTGARVPINAWRGSVPVDNALVTQPSPFMTGRRFRALSIIALVLNGNCYWLKVRGPLGDVISLEFVSRGWPIKTNGVITHYLVRLYRTGVTKRVEARDVEHLRFLELPELEGLGIGPVQASRVALEGMAAIREYAAEIFDSNDIPSGILTTDQYLDPDVSAAYKRKWYTKDADDPSPAGPSVRVLGQGLTYSRISLSPADAQWLESQAFGVLEVARLLGLPGDYLLAAVEGSSLTYQNLEMIDTSFYGRTLIPDYLERLEEGLTNVIVRGQEARADTAAFLRPDAKTRAEIDAIYLDKFVISPDEVRDRERWTGPAPKKPAPAPAPASQEQPA